MRLKDVNDAAQLRHFMTEPSPRLIELMGRLSGDVLVLGASGKMGPELVEMLLRADRAAGTQREVTAVARFGGESGQAVADQLSALGATVLRRDIAEPETLKELPQAENLIYMVGFKFGSSEDPGKAIQMNCVVPAEVAMAFPEARIVVFSSTNPYPLVPVESGGCTEEVAFAPHALYAWSIVGRETAFRAVASARETQRVCYYRLAYAQHLGYGVLVDLARMLQSGEPISLAIPAVNLLSQRDANDRALLGWDTCANPPVALNVCGPVVRVRAIVEDLARHMDVAPVYADEEGSQARISNDDFCVRQFGPYRDGVKEMIEAAARWVRQGGEDWGKPTMFGTVSGRY